NRYIVETYLPVHNAEFSRKPSDPASAFVALGQVDLAGLFYETAERIVGKDNTVSYDGIRVQIAPQPGRSTYVGLAVTVRRQLDGGLSVWRGPLALGFFDPAGKPT